MSVFFVSGCSSLQPGSALISVTVVTAEGSQTVEVSAGSTAREVLEGAGLIIDSLDRSDPPLYSVLQDGDTVHFVRVEEEYLVEQTVIAYDTQVLRNESLSEGERRLIQPGQNGLQENTYRILIEDGDEVSRTLSSTVVVTPAVAEIIMEGSQAPFTALPIPGILAYISAGNAWIIRENTGLRQPVVTTGDLDGRIFSISPDGRWLLYTRSGDGEEKINSLWVAQIEVENGKQFDLGVENIIHFADWIPGSQTGIGYSTTEIIPGPPGWEANNDLYFLNFSQESGWTSSPREALSQNLGGLYGWWGTEFLYSPEGQNMAYSRPDGFGLLNPETGAMQELVRALPVQTRSDWAWIPPIAWAPGSEFIYFVNHVPQEGVAVDEESQVFDLAVYPFVGGAPVSIIQDVGMFAYPLPSPQKVLENGERVFRVAFLQALEPRQSRTSSYQLMVMDQDGSNLRRLFPVGEGQGLSPHQYYWLPQYAVESSPMYLALIYQGDLWLVDTESGEAQQLTGDGLVTAIDWN
ncbi:MAG: G5 domain-containing protein [Anaerolineales bacterium]|nr:G5 domain-containing protein [Anaerolineales bacterium]